MTLCQRDVLIPANGVQLEGTLSLPDSLPDNPRGAVLFAHGSGSSRHSSRNRYVAEVLQAHGIATLLFDLLTANEDQDREKRFDIALLTERLVAATLWLQGESETKGMNIGYFGASTGAAAALRAASGLGLLVAAVVSRGGRPDLAGPHDLARVTSPTLLIVGGWDEGVIELNQQAFDWLRCEKSLVIVPGATHLFEEPGTLEQAASHAAAWFLRWLSPPSQSNF